MNSAITDNLGNEFYRDYGPGEKAVHAFFASGRVNLLGEHTDYNGGWVMPFAIPFGTWLLIRKSNENLWKFKSNNQKLIAQMTSDKLPEPVGKTWINYPLGVIREFILRGVNVHGLEMLYWGNIPNGAGLSSSASIEMVTAIALNELFACNFAMQEIIQIARKAENDFAGVNCGIMDMFAIGMGMAGKAIALNCETLEFKMIPVLFEEYRFVIANTKKERRLAGSEYNKRREECARVVEIINKTKPLKNLAQLKPAEWIKLEYLIENEKLRRRARHVITENQRVLDSLDILHHEDASAFGHKMIESHISLMKDYDVSCRELDAMVDEALQIEGCVGARMTGAGFGGCTINLVRHDKTDIFQEIVGKNYEEKTGLKPEFYLVEPVDGILKNKSLKFYNHKHK
jgi:galactokinase